MAKMHWCTCVVNLAGQGLTFVKIEKQFPVSWPEVQVLMLTHGEENVTEIVPVAISEVEPQREKERLAAKYKWQPVEQVFPGRSFRMELLMPASREDLPRVEFDGTPMRQQPDDDDDHIGPLEPPVGPPVFSQGKHQPPAKQPEP